MNDYSRIIKIAKDEIDKADAIVIGAGAGLSTSAGLEYDGERFKINFPDFIKEYGFSDMYSAGFYPYETEEEYWAYWSRYIYINRYEPKALDAYLNLLKLVEDKDYFVLTTNVDHCFQKAGFDKHRLFYTQGDYGLFQCSVPCTAKTYDNEETIMMMVREQRNMRIPAYLIPRCPICGEKMTPNLRADSTFVQDDGWDKAAERYELFLNRHKNLSVVYLELGVGYNTPGIIKYPFWNLTAKNGKARYICINAHDTRYPIEISNQALSIKEDIAKAIKDLLFC